MPRRYWLYLYVTYQLSVALSAAVYVPLMLLGVPQTVAIVAAAVPAVAICARRMLRCPHRPDFS